MTVVSCCAIRSDLLNEFEEDWNRLRHSIAADLGLKEPPPIHMRLMWGKDVHLRKHRKQANPYRRASFEQIQGYVLAAHQIIAQYTQKKYALSMHSQSARRDEAIQTQKRYLQTEVAQRELGQIRAAGSDLYERYFKAIVNPLMNLLAQALVSLQLVLTTARAESVDCLVGRFPTPKGFDEKEVLDAAIGICGLDLVNEVERVSCDDHALAQASDVIAFTTFRDQMARHGFIKVDETLMRIANSVDYHPFSSANLEHLVRRKLPDFGARSLTLHYSVARRVIETRNAALAAKMVSVEEFLARAQEAHEAGDAGVSIFL